MISHNNPNINLKDVLCFTLCLSKASHTQPVSPPAHIHIPVSIRDTLRHSEDTALFGVINVQLCVSVCDGNQVTLWQKSSLIINTS